MACLYTTKIIDSYKIELAFDTILPTTTAQTSAYNYWWQKNHCSKHEKFKNKIKYCLACKNNQINVFTYFYVMNTAKKLVNREIHLKVNSLPALTSSKILLLTLKSILLDMMFSLEREWPVCCEGQGRAISVTILSFSSSLAAWAALTRFIVNFFLYPDTPWHKAKSSNLQQNKLKSINKLTS